MPDAIAITPEFSTVVVEGNYLLVDGVRSGPRLSGSRPCSTSPCSSTSTTTSGSSGSWRGTSRSARSVASARAWALGPDEANARVIEASAERAPVPAAAQRPVSRASITRPNSSKSSSPMPCAQTMVPSICDEVLQPQHDAILVGQLRDRAPRRTRPRTPGRQELLVLQAHEVRGPVPVSGAAEVDESDRALVHDPVARLEVAVGEVQRHREPRHPFELGSGGRKLVGVGEPCRGIHLGERLRDEVGHVVG